MACTAQLSLASLPSRASLYGRPVTGYAGSQVARSPLLLPTAGYTNTRGHAAWGQEEKILHSKTVRVRASSGRNSKRSYGAREKRAIKASERSCFVKLLLWPKKGTPSSSVFRRPLTHHYFVRVQAAHTWPYRSGQLAL